MRPLIWCQIGGCACERSCRIGGCACSRQSGPCYATDALLSSAHLKAYTERVFDALAALPRYRLYAGTLDLKHAGGPAASRSRLFIVLIAASS